MPPHHSHPMSVPPTPLVPISPSAPYLPSFLLILILRMFYKLSRPMPTHIYRNMNARNLAAQTKPTHPLLLSLAGRHTHRRSTSSKHATDPFCDRPSWQVWPTCSSKLPLRPPLVPVSFSWQITIGPSIPHDVSMYTPILHPLLLSPLYSLLESP